MNGLHPAYWQQVVVQRVSPDGQQLDISMIDRPDKVVIGRGI
ncbi:hypothetical protein [Cryptosporangium aurantiacum]|nr:hypothetical protein [Cryptosporangium aurantiacum]